VKHKFKRLEISGICELCTHEYVVRWFSSQRWLPIQLLTGPHVEQLCWSRPP